MLYVLGLLGWMIFGFIVTWVATVIHLVNAIRKGYDPINYAAEHQVPMVKGLMHSGNGIVAFIWGMIVWPARLVWAINTHFPSLYE